MSEATTFTPVSALVGGALIGAAAALLLLRNGRVAGISGILGGALFGEDRGWRLAFLAGLPLGAGLVAVATGTFPVHVDASAPTLVAAGLLVGFGTRFGNGCTSGHGVCGLARGSARSLSATLTFMGVAAVIVFLVRHVLGGLS